MACLLVLYISDKDILCIVYFFSLHFILNLFISFFTFLSVFFGIIPCSFSIRLLSSLHFILLKVFFHIFFSLPILLQFPFTCYRMRWSLSTCQIFLLLFFCCVLKAIRYHLILYQTFLSLSLSFFCFCLIILMESPARTN